MRFSTITVTSPGQCWEYWEQNLSLRVPDRTKGRDAPTNHTVNNLTRKLSVRDNADSFWLEFSGYRVDEIDHVRLAVNGGIMYDRIR